MKKPLVYIRDGEAVDELVVCHDGQVIVIPLQTRVMAKLAAQISERLVRRIE